MNGSSGGAAAASGMEFQHRVAAWMATHILAEKEATPLLDLPVNLSLEWLQCEAEEPVDDLITVTSDDGIIFGQAKRAVDLSPSEQSHLASALDQFVRQFVLCRQRSTGAHPWERPLDLKRDRLALITTSKSSDKVRTTLPSILKRLRTLPQAGRIEDATTNNQERHVLAIITSHLARSWNTVLGVLPTVVELRNILSLIHVLVLDIDDGGEAERGARNLLRASVLQDPASDSTAWAQLITFCSDLASRRSSVDRIGLQRELLSSGVTLRVPQSFRADINKLIEHSAATLETVAHLACIRIGYTPIKINRASTLALRTAAQSSSILVVGEPGAGKSGTLHDFVRSLRSDGQDNVYLALDHLDANSADSLRNELRLEHDLVSVLSNWPGREPAYLVIDALDAARGESSESVITDLIRRVRQITEGRWRVVASIRKFDLRYGVTIRELFSGSPDPIFHDDEFLGVRHLNVPLLSPEEQSAIMAQSPALNSVFLGVGSELKELLRVLFNMRIFAELVSGGVAATDLAPIRTQLELLDRYWLHRVIGMDKMGDARETILRQACTKMIASRVLRIDRQAVLGCGHPSALDAILSAQVMVEWQAEPTAPPDRYVLAFAHNLLFDYAASRLVIRATSEGLAEKLLNDPELFVFARPSLIWHFRYLWTIDSAHRQFWVQLFEVMRMKGIPEIGKLLGPSAVAELAKSPDDFGPLYALFANIDPNAQELAEQTLHHISGALLTLPRESAPLIGPNAGPWCELLERLSQTLRRSLAYKVRLLLTSICECPDHFTADQRTAAGAAARHLLDFAWTEPPRDKWLIAHALQCVCRTFISDQAASTSLLRRCLEPLRISQYGFEEMPWLAREVGSILSHDPTLVGDVYGAAFRHEEPSTESTEMGRSPLMGLTSNRKQDYHLALYELSEFFPTFLRSAPEHATRALIQVMETYVAQQHSPRDDDEELCFDFNGHKARVRRDHSAIWDEGSLYEHDEPMKMLKAFEDYLESLAHLQSPSDQLDSLVRLVVLENRLSVIWRRVLALAVRNPDSIGNLLQPLTSVLPLLTCEDTSVHAGGLITTLFPRLESTVREQIERTILNIPERPLDEYERKAAIDLRNRLLGCLMDDKLVTSDARRILAELRTQNAVPANQPTVRYTEWSGPYGEVEFLRDQGVPVDAEVNRAIRELEQPVKDFANTHLNSTPNTENVTVIFGALQVLQMAILNADSTGVHVTQRDHAVDSLAAACATIAGVTHLEDQQEAAALVREVLLDTSRNPNPVHDPEHDKHFDDHPSWSTPAPRLRAAQGLVVLARNTAFAQPDVTSALEILSRDPVPAVRFQIARRLNALYKTAPELMWKLIAQFTFEEKSGGVLQGLLTGPLHTLAGADPDKVAEFVSALFERSKSIPGARKVREFCISILSGLYIWRGNNRCQKIILDIATRSHELSDEASTLLGCLREPLTHGPTSPPEPAQDAVRKRALDVLARILSCSCAQYRDLKGRLTQAPFADWPIADQECAKMLARLIDHAASEIYFASGAFHVNSQHNEKNTKTPDYDRVKRFYQEARPLLELLADANLPSVTHHLLELLQFLIPSDPRTVFLHIDRVLRVAKEGDYAYDSLAAGLVVQLVERFLADYRFLLRTDQECREALVRILDVFVHVGWPTARKLAYRLEDIFR